MYTEALKERRNHLGYSHQEVADKAQIERSYYTKIENGLAPSVKVAQRIGKILGVDWTIFFTNNGAKNAHYQTA